jgi:hypothetical protein
MVSHSIFQGSNFSSQGTTSLRGRSNSGTSEKGGSRSRQHTPKASMADITKSAFGAAAAAFGVKKDGEGKLKALMNEMVKIVDTK